MNINFAKCTSDDGTSTLSGILIHRKKKEAPPTAKFDVLPSIERIVMSSTGSDT